jgi:acyl-CoA thioester hydrolase
MPEVIVPIHLRWGDMDVYGHINNVAFAQFMEQARVQLMAETGFEPKNFSEAHVVARNEIDYILPLEYQSDPVHMYLWVEHVGNATYTVGYELRDGDTVHMKAKTRMVTVDLETNRPVRIPEKMREYLVEALRE